MNDFPRRENPYPEAGAGEEQATNELTQARDVLAHMKSHHNSDYSPHLLELLERLVNAGFDLAVSVGALEGKVCRDES